MWHLKFILRKLKTKLHKIICCIYRHQASESNTEDGEEKANKQAKIKNAANLLQQRKMLQRNLRNLQQHTLSREILSGKISFSKFNEKHCIRDICILNNFFYQVLRFYFWNSQGETFPFSWKMLNLLQENMKFIPFFCSLHYSNCHFKGCL